MKKKMGPLSIDVKLKALQRRKERLEMRMKDVWKEVGTSGKQPPPMDRVDSDERSPWWLTLTKQGVAMITQRVMQQSGSKLEAGVQKGIDKIAERLLRRKAKRSKG